MDAHQARQLVSEAGKELKNMGLIAGSWGNISIRLDDTYMVITPSGLGYEMSTPEDMVVVNYHIMSYTGRKPSSEGKLHAAIYLQRPDIHAVVHTHSMDASTVASARIEIPVMNNDMEEKIGGSIRVAKYALPSTKKIVRETMKALEDRMAALMANHGAIGIGKDLREAFEMCQLLEHSCREYINHKMSKDISSIGIQEALANSLKSISTRLDNEFMQITPVDVNYNSATTHFTKVNYRTLEPVDKTPAKDWKIHAEIYRKMSKISAITRTDAPHTVKLSKKGLQIPAILDDMAQIIGASLKISPTEESKSILNGLKRRLAVLVTNEPAVCIGRDLSEAITVAEVLEKTCKAYLEAEALGGAQAIHKLEAIFMHYFYLFKYSRQKK